MSRLFIFTTWPMESLNNLDFKRAHPLQLLCRSLLKGLFLFSLKMLEKIYIFLYSFIYSPICATPSPKKKTFEKLGTLGFWTSTTSCNLQFCLIASKNHFLIFATPYRRCFPPPCNLWGPPKTKICRLQTKKNGVIKRLHSIISGSCRLQILCRLHMRVAHSCCPPIAMLAFFSSAHVRRR